MIELTVKTLDSQNRTFSVPDDLTVEQFKKHISPSVNIPAESQRLIYCGRVLDDEKKLIDYNLQEKVIHLVERLPPAHLRASDSSSSDNAGGSRSHSSPRSHLPGMRRNRFGNQTSGGNTMYLGAMAFPADLMDAQGLNIPQARRMLTQSRFGVARYMLRQLTAVVNRLENPNADSSTSSPANQNDSNPENGFPVVVQALLGGAYNGEAHVQFEIRADQSSSQASADQTSSQAPAQGGSNEIPSAQSSNAESARTETDPDLASLAASFFPMPPQPSAQSTSEEQNETPADSATDGAASTSAPSNDNDNQPSSSSANLHFPPPASVGELMNQLVDINRRLEPYIAQYRTTMLNDPVLPSIGENGVDSVQRTINLVSEAMHLLSHLYHSLSDIVFDVSEPPPRPLRCHPVLIQHSAVFQSGIPIQAVIPTRNAPTSNNNTTSNLNDTAQEEDVLTTVNESEAEGEENGENEQANDSMNEEPELGVLMEVEHDSITVGSVETVSVEIRNSNDLSNSTAFSTTNPPEIVQRVVNALTNGFIQSQQQNLANNNHTTSASVQTNSSSAPDTASSDSSSDSNIGGTTAGEPSSQNQSQSSGQQPGSRSNSRRLRFSPLGPSMAACFDPCLPCNSHHIRNSRRRNNPFSSTSNPPTNISTSSNSTAETQADSTPQSDQQRAQQTSQSDERRNASNDSNDSDLFQGAQGNGPTTNALEEFIGRLMGPRFPGTSLLSGTQMNPNQNSNTGARSTIIGMSPIVEMISEPVINLVSSSNGQSRIIRIPHVPQVNVGSGPQEMPSVLRDSDSFLEGLAVALNVVLREINVFDFESTKNRVALLRFRHQVQRLLWEKFPAQRSNPSSSLHPSFDSYFSREDSFFPRDNSYIPQDIITPAHRRDMVAGICAELKPCLESVLSDVTMKSDVDVVASVMEVIKEQLLEILTITFHRKTLNGFSQDLVKQCNSMACKIFQVLHLCCEKGQKGVFDISDKFVKFARGHIPNNLRMWLPTVLFLLSRSYLEENEEPTLSSNYIVRRANSSQPTTSSNSLESETKKASCSTSQAAAVPSAEAPKPMPPQEPMESESAEEESKTPPFARLLNSSNVPLPDVLIGAEEWHSHVSRDWVPLITRDTQCQRRQSPQRPFSDAYLSGMPNKRRRLIQASKPQSHSVSQFISESLERAINTAEVTNTGVKSAVIQNAAVDSSLRTAYIQQLRAKIDLNSDPDFNPEKYPNASKYFKK